MKYVNILLCINPIVYKHIHNGVQMSETTSENACFCTSENAQVKVIIINIIIINIFLYKCNIILNILTKYYRLS